jgi:hypothetical protein
VGFYQEAAIQISGRRGSNHRMRRPAVGTTARKNRPFSHVSFILRRD